MPQCKNKRCKIPIDPDELQALLRIKKAELAAHEPGINIQLPFNTWERRENKACELWEEIQALEKGYCSIECQAAAEEKDYL